VVSRNQLAEAGVGRTAVSVRMRTMRSWGTTPPRRSESPAIRWSTSPGRSSTTNRRRLPL